MSETIKTVLLNYVVCSLVGGVLEQITPVKMKKTIRIIVTVFLISSVIFPLFNSDFDLTAIYENGINNTEAEYSTLVHLQNLTEKKIYDEIRNVLINLNINEYEIYITTDISETESTVYLDEIRIEIAQEFENKIEAVKNDVNQEYKSILKVGVKNE